MITGHGETFYEIAIISIIIRYNYMGFEPPVEAIACCLRVKTSVRVRPFMRQCLTLKAHFHTVQARFHMKDFARTGTGKTEAHGKSEMVDSAIFCC